MRRKSIEGGSDGGCFGGDELGAGDVFGENRRKNRCAFSFIVALFAYVKPRSRRNRDKACTF
ncbi:hypothetical protein LINGRAHAP2_LOCUS8486 [Linum grandiflorum]